MIRPMLLGMAFVLGGCGDASQETLDHDAASHRHAAQTEPPPESDPEVEAVRRRTGPPASGEREARSTDAMQRF